MHIYKVASEEAILALIFNFFAKNLPKEQKEFLENLDIGYLSAESSAGASYRKTSSKY